MPTLNWDSPYPSRRSPVFANNLVATSQPLAVAAGLDTLKKGGNAVDAAVATAITLTIVEPNNNGIGGDAFALVHDGSRLHGLNASGRSPATWSAERFAGRRSMPVRGWDSVTVPGAVSAWVALSRKFGRLPFAELFTAALSYAREGYPVGPKSAFFWQQAAKSFKDYPAFMDTFTNKGRPPGPGDKFRLPDHARTLEIIAASEGEAFYRGELAQAIAADAQKHGAAMSLADLEQHTCDWVEPISMDAFAAELHEIPPNSQGLMALISLGILKHTGIADMPLDSADSIHLQIEAQRLAYAQMERSLSDIATMQTPVESLLDPGFLLDTSRAIDLRKASPQPSALGASPDTVYLTTADASGLMVSLIQSNYRGFGSGIVVPGTGISLQNRGAGFRLEAGHPNQVGPAKRPYHTIIPGFVTRHDMPYMSFGVMGGHMQAQGHLQMMVRILLHQQNPQAASDAPRWHVQEDGRVALENGFDPALVQDLQSRGHEILLNQPEYLFGGAQLIVKMEDGYCAGSDHRKEGLAAGF